MVSLVGETSLSSLKIVTLSNFYQKSDSNKIGSRGVKYLTKAELPLLEYLQISTDYTYVRQLQNRWRRIKTLNQRKLAQFKTNLNQ